MNECNLFAGRVGLVGLTNTIITLRGLILIPILTKTLGAEGYGIWSQIFAARAINDVAVFGGKGWQGRINAAFYAIMRFLAPDYIRISVLIFLAAVDQIMIEYFTGFRQIRKYSAFLISQTVGEIALIAALVLSGFGLFGAIISLFIARVVTSVIGFLWIKSDINISKPSFSVVKVYLPLNILEKVVENELS